MNITIVPTKLAGTVTPPASKSQSHRVLIANALAGRSAAALPGLADSQDIRATRRCMERLLGREELPLLECGESGSTLRFLIPVALALRGGGRFTGHGRLMERPQKPYFDLFDEKGISYGQSGGVLTVRGELPPGVYRLPGDVSSQFVTGLLYALPLLDGDSEILLSSPLESRDYVAMTLDVLEKSGVRVENQDYGRFLVPGRQSFRAGETAVEADWSQAGFWYAANVLGSDLDIRGLNASSAQADAAIAQYALRLAQPGEVSISVSQTPDLAPPLAAMAAVREGDTHIVGAARLRLKESDRLASIHAVLSALGAEVAEGPDSLTIAGRSALAGGVTVDSCNDHRIAMMAAIAATRCQKPVTIAGAECVAKSYPDFWKEYARLGGKLREVTV